MVMASHEFPDCLTLVNKTVRSERGAVTSEGQQNQTPPGSVLNRPALHALC